LTENFVRFGAVWVSGAYY